MTGSLQVKNGKYYIVLNCYIDGKRKPKWIATGLPEKGNKRKAEQMLRIAIAEALQHTDTFTATIQFSAYLKYWLKSIAPRIDEVTFQGYSLLINRHIIPYFDSQKIQLNEVTRQILQEFLDKKAENGRLDGKGGLSPKSIRELKNVLNQALNEAIREEYISANPCTLLRIPPRTPSVTKFYSQEQLNILFSVTQNEPLYPLIKAAIIYGLRRSELLGLKWDSINFENSTLTVKHTVVKVSKVIKKDKAKSKSSYRSFPLLPEMRNLFLGIYEDQQKNQASLGKSYKSTDYVFCWPDGRPFSPDYVSHRFKAILEKNNLPHIRFHELRHSCASFLINNDFGLKDVQEWMGHADISTTADIYGHLETKRKIAMANKLADCISDGC